MKVLGLDPSLTGFGWALYDTEGEGRARCPQRGRWKTAAKDMFVGRYVHLRESLVELLRDTGVKLIGLESPIFGESYSPGMYGLFLFVCEALWMEERDVVFFSPGQIKAHARRFLGRPQKPKWIMMKPDMIEAAKLDTGGKGRWSNDEADAYWAARSGARFWQFLDGQLGESDLTEDETHQFTLTHTFVKGPKAGKTRRSGIIYRENERFFRWSELSNACQENRNQEDAV